MRLRWLLPGAAAAMVLGVGGAVASHAPQIDPALVPAGLLVSHNHVSSFNIAPFARAVKHHRADVFIQHFNVAPNSALPWHTHPGPGIVAVVSGTLGYQRQVRRRCVTTWYPAGTGFVDPGFGHVHRAISRGDGFHAYVTWVTPTGSPSQTILVAPPPACS
jgi:hypothetical protein